MKFCVLRTLWHPRRLVWGDKPKNYESVECVYHTLCWWYGPGLPGDPASEPDCKTDLLIYSNGIIEHLLSQNILIGGCFAESNKYMSDSCHTPSPRLTSYCSNQSSPTATHALKGSAQISQWPILPLSSKALNL